MARAYTVLIALLLLPAVALAQGQTQTAPEMVDSTTMSIQSTRDPPPGFPYNTGGGSVGNNTIVSAQVPLRDFLSSRQDLQWAALVKQIESLESWLQRLLDERDRQYGQRFGGQEAATASRFAAQEAAVAAALASAKEATLKAEASYDKRFDAGNEIKEAMAEQARSFMPTSTADARFKAIEDKLDSVYDRLNTMQAIGQGSADTWGWLVGIAGVLIALISTAFAIVMATRSRDRP